jgi:hypothetical protein
MYLALPEAHVFVTELAAPDDAIPGTSYRLETSVNVTKHPRVTLDAIV